MLYLLSELLNTILTHFGIGAGLAVITVAFFWRRQRRRPIFRFGGDDPISFGSQAPWVRWIIISYFFEVLSSLHPGLNLYKELALSALEAVALTFGLFLVDRVAMIFVEPESHWKVKSIRKESAGPAVTNSSEPPPVPAVAKLPAALPIANQPAPDDPTYIERRTGEVMEAAQDSVALARTRTSKILDKARATASGIIGYRGRKAAEKKDARTAERRDRLFRLSEILRGH